MFPRRKKKLEEFLDLSIIIPFTGNSTGFTHTIRANHVYFRQNGVEVIVTTGEDPGEAASLPEEFPFISWKIISTAGHGDMDAGIQLNTGLHYASRRYILILLPGLTLRSDIVYDLCWLMHLYPGSFGIIPATWPPAPSAPTDLTGQAELYRVLIAEKGAIRLAGGFGWFGDSLLDNISVQRRLELAGYKKMVIPGEGAVNVSPWPAGTFPRDIPAGALSSALYPSSCQERTKFMPGEEKLLFDWMQHRPDKAAGIVLRQFSASSLLAPDVFLRQYGIICLIQVRNEASNLPDVLTHLGNYVDGIVLLDDGSDDGSYEKAASERLLLKVRKAYTGHFNDLENRNLLLQLGYLFKAAWFVFLDADERFDPRFGDLRNIAANAQADTVSFRLVHVWDKEGYYRKDLPEGNNGILRRYRMFRNKGFMQIVARRELHFCATPYRRHKVHSPVLLLHYGLKDQKIRALKRNSYLLQDKDGHQQGYVYDYLADTDPELGSIEEIA